MEKAMSLPGPLLAQASHPQTAEGKRNWSWSAMHPGEQPSSAATLPESEGSFWDFLDIINPLQHIPILGSVYRAVTGDTIGAPARILGGTLFGGPLGFLSGTAGTILAETTGGDVGEHVLASLGSGTSAQSAASAYAKSAALRV
jgi:hypothetical protein